MIIVLGIGLRPNIDAYIEILTDLSLRVYPTPYKLFAKLDAETTQAGISVVLADQIASIALPAYMSSAKIVAHRSLTTSELFPARRQDIALQRLIEQYRFSRSSFLNESVLDIMRKYDVKYVITFSGTDLDLQLHLAPQWFEWQIDDQSLTLYKVREIPSVTATLQGNTAMESRQWAAGRQKFEEALKQNPNDALALMGLSEYYRINGDYPQALSTLQYVAALSDVSDLHNRLGRLHAQMGQYDQAIAELDAAQKDSPGISDYHLDLGTACLATGDQACADQQFQASVEAQGQTDPATKLISLAGIWQG
ncbi:MAG TPA: tetratricopeptide repeat protein, partial [Anaerolineae bacterium]